MSGKPGVVAQCTILRRAVGSAGGPSIFSSVMRPGGSWRDHRTELAVQQKNRMEEIRGHGLAKDIYYLYTLLFFFVMASALFPFLKGEKLNFCTYSLTLCG
jgi:hypothetical protein